LMRKAVKTLQKESLVKAREDKRREDEIRTERVKCQLHAETTWLEKHGKGGRGLALRWKFPLEVIEKGIVCPGRF